MVMIGKKIDYHYFFLGEIMIGVASSDIPNPSVDRFI